MRKQSREDKSILEYFLNELKVSHTRRYAYKLYNRHIHKYNMYGLKLMCGIYKIKTIGLFIPSKDFTKLSFPCILHTYDAFTIGLSHNYETITYLKDGEKIVTSGNMFKEEWTGKALIVSDTKEAIEPHYFKHKVKDISLALKFYLLPIIFISTFFIGFFLNVQSKLFLIEASAFINLIGSFVCTMLLQKQLYGISQYGDKICTLLHQTNCNTILSGDKAYLGEFSWSEIGLGFFIANTILLSLFPLSISVTALVNWAAMFFAIWSIYYQWRVIQSWCMLCIMAQILIWTSGILVIYFYQLSPLTFNWSGFIITIVAHILCIIFVHNYAVKVKALNDSYQITQKYRALKSNRLVAKTLIENETFFPTNINDSKILFGNRHADLLITLLSNPHCYPCAEMHKKIENILEVYRENVCIQYIFLSFRRDLDNSCRYLISKYDPMHLSSTFQFYSNWYKFERNNSQKIIQQNLEYIRQDYVEKEWKKHCNWCRKTQLSSTPTILINGHVLPKVYDLEDIPILLKYL